MTSDVGISQKWRFWPIMCLAFFYPINNSLVNLAIPLYFFNQGLEIFLIGFLVAGFFITYCFSPLLLNKMGDKLGRKRSIIIALLGTSIAQIIFYFTLEPLMFLISRMIEGFVMGLFWTSLQSSISDKNSTKNENYISRYNLSWNSGALLGFLVGTIILLNIDDVSIIFYTAPILIFINLIISIVFFQETKKHKDNDETSQNLNVKSNFELNRIYIPVVLPILLVLAFGLAKNSINFSYPIKSEIIGFQTYTVYLLAFLTILTQLISTTFATYLKITVLKKITVMSLVALIIINILLGINYNFFVFILLFLLLGLFAGTLYSFGLKLSILLNIQYHTSKYTSINESILGTTYLITPIICGYIAIINLNLSFYAISLGLFSMLILYSFFLKQMKLKNILLH